MIRTPQRQQELDDIVRRGRAKYAERVEQLLHADDHGKFVAIDVSTGEYEIDVDEYAAITRLNGRLPGVESLLVRVGSPTTYDIRRAER